MRLILDHHGTKLDANWLDEAEDHAPVLKLFCPWGAATWLITERKLGAVPEETILFGLCDLGFGEPELGYVALQELIELRGPAGLRVERDLNFKPKASLLIYWQAARSAGQITDDDTSLKLAYRRMLSDAKRTGRKPKGILLGDLARRFE